jgi:hypothetical protein
VLREVEHVYCLLPKMKKKDKCTFRFILIISLFAALVVLSPSLSLSQFSEMEDLTSNVRRNSNARGETRFEDGRFRARDSATSARTFATTAAPCPAIPIKSLRPHLRSQSQEDQRLLGWFDGLCNGTYIEMGALDGERFSNSFVFNRAFQWKGLLVEASPSSFAKLVRKRPNELASVNAAVCDERRTVHFVDSTHHAVRGI